MNPIFDKLQELLDKVPEETRLLIINKYTSDGKPQSKRVDKVLKIIDKFSDTEKEELSMFLGEVMKKKKTEEAPMEKE